MIDEAETEKKAAQANAHAKTVSALPFDEKQQNGGE